MSKPTDNLPVAESENRTRSQSESVRSRTLYDFPEPPTEAAWRHFLLRADFRMHYVSPEYFLEPFLADKNPFAILTFQGDRLMGVISGEREGNSVNCGLNCRPQIAFDPASDHAIYTSALDELARISANAILVNVFSWSRLPAFVEAGYSEFIEQPVIVIDLTLPPDVLLRKLSRGKKSNINHAKRKGVTIQLATLQGQFDDYYRIYFQWCERKGLRPVPAAVLSKAWGLESNRKLFLAYFEGKPIAGSIIRYVSGGMAEYSANCSLEEALPLRPNSLLLWTAIQWACDEKLRWFSLAGGHPFLQQFGGAAFPQYRYSKDTSLFSRYLRMESLNRGVRQVLRKIRGTLLPARNNHSE